MRATQWRTGETSATQLCTGETKTIQIPIGETKTTQIPTGQTKTIQIPTGQTKTTQIPTGQTKTTQPTGQTKTVQIPTGQTKTTQIPTGEQPGAMATNVDAWARPGPMTPTVGVGTLRRLSELDTGGQQVLSAYLDPVPELACGGCSVAVFATADRSVCEIVPLPAKTQKMVVRDTIPWLEPLAGLFTEGNSGVAVVGRCGVRLLRGNQRMLVEFATIEGASQVSVSGDWPARAESLTEERIAEQVERLNTLLMRAHRRRAFERLVIASPPELWPLIARALDGELHDRLVGLVEQDLQHASSHEIARVVASLISPEEQEDATSCRSSTTTPSIPCQRTGVQPTTTRCLAGKRRAEPAVMAPQVVRAHDTRNVGRTDRAEVACP